MFGAELTDGAFVYTRMSTRRTELERLAERLAARSDIADAYTAKSFTDRLFVLEIEAAGTVPDDVDALLGEHNLAPACEVYGDGDQQMTFAGADDSEQYRFVDMQSRGTLQSYVVS
jgi:hypothetical protein